MKSTMIFPINDGWRLSIDNLNVTLEKSRVAGKRAEISGETNWVAVSYYNNIHQALKRMVDLDIQNLDDFRKISDRIDALHDVIDKLEFKE
jgi:hypothetical protein